MNYLVVGRDDLTQQAFGGVTGSLTRSDLRLVNLQPQPYVESVLHQFVVHRELARTGAVKFRSEPG